MADSKISALPASTTPLAGTEVLPIVQSSTTKQVSVANLTAGRAVSATSIQFGSGTVLSTYEEGTWTPGKGAGVVLVGTFSSSGYYTKVGRLVTVSGVIAGSTSVAFGNGGEIVTGLPFASNAASMGIFADSGYNNISGARTIASALYSVGVGVASSNIVFSITYQV
jgi:hypothetical protein